MALLPPGYFMPEIFPSSYWVKAYWPENPISGPLAPTINVYVGEVDVTLIPAGHLSRIWQPYSDIRATLYPSSLVGVMLMSDNIGEVQIALVPQSSCIFLEGITYIYLNGVLTPVIYLGTLTPIISYKGTLT